MYNNLDLSELGQINFLRKNLRSFYDAEILNWQYFRLGNLNSSLYLLQKNDQYIASQGMIPIHLISQNLSRLTAKSETSFLLPEFRGKGLFEDLYSFTIDKAEEDKVELIWGFTALSKVWRKKLKFNVYDGLITETELQISFWISIRSIINKKLPIWNKFKQSIKSIISALKVTKILGNTASYKVIEIDMTNLEDMASVLTVFEKWKAEYPSYISLDLTVEYLQWRLGKNPKLKYRLIGLYHKDVLYGFGVINTTASYAYLVEFIVSDRTKLKNGLHSLLSYWKSLNISSHINYWSSNQNEYSIEISNILMAMGANKMVNNTMNFVLKSTKYNSFTTDDVSQFYINGLWTEGFKI